MGNYIKPTSDLAAKKMFQDPVASVGFIKTFLGIDAKEVTLLNTQSIHLQAETIKPFSTIVDVLVELEDGGRVIVEIQASRQVGLVKRAFTYCCERQTDQLERLKAIYSGKSVDIYEKMTPIYVVVITEQDYFIQETPIHSYSLKNDDGISLEASLPDNVLDRTLFKMVFLELGKFDQASLSDDEFAWFNLFLGRDIPKNSSQAVKSARSVLDRANFSKEELDMLSAIERQTYAHFGELETARSEGELRTRIENARDLLKLNVDVKTISEGIKLPLEQVLQLQKELNLTP